MDGSLTVSYNFAQFFQDRTGAYSMTRLLNFLAFWPAAYVLIAERETGMFATFLSVYGILGSVSTASDAYASQKKVETDVVNVDIRK